MQKLLKNEIFQRSYFGIGLFFWICLNIQDLGERANDISGVFLLPHKKIFELVTFIILTHIIFNKFVTWLCCFITFNVLVILVTITRLIPTFDMYMPGKHPIDSGLVVSLITIYGLIGGIDYLMWKLKPMTLGKSAT